MEFKWFFSNQSSPSNHSVDSFADSKFGIDRWTSFAREIIQNSLDVRDDENKPVYVSFDINKDLSLNDIPGGETIRDILTRCVDAASNNQTKQAYKKGVEILSKPRVYCLKVSDYNTKGVETGRDKAWGALVFDEGKSFKQRPGAAGSHGVGKKVPFIISTCNTVFYATKNKYDDGKSDMLVQGKMALINWQDKDGIWKCPEGWFGKENPVSTSTMDTISPLSNDEVEYVNPYFCRKDAFGTDVIIIGVNAYDNEETIKKAIISSIYENFFVAIKEKILIVNVFGEEFTHSNLERFKKWYEPTESIKNTMQDLMRIYESTPDVIPVCLDGKNIGTIELYFDDTSELNRKYYTVVREHGMRIREYRINRSDKAFSALAVIKGKDLNALLLHLENAAHDDFVTDSDDLEQSEETDRAKNALKEVKKEIESFIVEKTKIDEGKDQRIEGLDQIISVPGFSPKITSKDSKTRIRRYKVNKKKPKENRVDPPTSKPTTPPAPQGETKKRKQKTEKVYNAFSFGPVFVKNPDGYLLRLKVKHDMKECEFRIHSINSDEKADNSIADILTAAFLGGRKYPIHNGCIGKIKLQKDTEYEIQIKTSYDIRYRLTADLIYKE